MTESKEFLFNSLQVCAIANSLKINEVCKDKVELLTTKFMEISHEMENIQNKLDLLGVKKRKLHEDIKLIENDAKNQYSNTLKIIVQDMQIPFTSWKASLVFKDGNPIGVKIIEDNITIDNKTT